MSVRAVAASLTLLTMVAIAPPEASAKVFMRTVTECTFDADANVLVNVLIKAGDLDLRWRGTGLPPGTAMSCGYYCGSIGTGGIIASCGTVDAHGQWRFGLKADAITCSLFIPAAGPTTGLPGDVCVPALP